MSIQVKCIDVYGIEDRLRKSKDPHDKEVWHYIKKLKESAESWKRLTHHAIKKLRECEKKSK